MRKEGAKRRIREGEKRDRGRRKRDERVRLVG